LTNDILTQKADKVIRYNELEQERIVLRRTLLANRRFKKYIMSR